ncbi:MAG TPA: hypothetical protein VKK79_16750 [Candidatus Lokiarchaeia archaeon]|nr:hypothetical protein [Candidatus Lokiarchaeia archaeon]
MTSAYFEEKIKPEGGAAAAAYLDDREKAIWQWFSHDEQEEIRRMLKDTKNSEVFTSRLKLKNGLYLCEECAEWVDTLEAEQEVP